MITTKRLSITDKVYYINDQEHKRTIHTIKDRFVDTKNKTFVHEPKVPINLPSPILVIGYKYLPVNFGNTISEVEAKMLTELMKGLINNVDFKHKDPM